MRRRVEDLNRDWFAVLGLDAGAAPEAVRRSYRRLAGQHHPDVSAADDAEERFKDIARAYMLLTDPVFMHDWRAQHPPTNGNGATAGPATATSARPAGPGKAAADFRVRVQAEPRGGPVRLGGDRRGRDVSAHVTLSFEQAAVGATVRLKVAGRAVCDLCAGTRAAPGFDAVICAECGGVGTVPRPKGDTRPPRTCRGCLGTGMQVDEECPVCDGKGTQRKTVSIDAHVPAGIRDGEQVRLPHRVPVGEGPLGDVLLNVHVEGHPQFTRRGSDIAYTAHLSQLDAHNGCELHVPTIVPGRSVLLRVPPGTRNGQTFRVPGEGMRASTPSGDLVVTVRTGT